MDEKKMEELIEKAGDGESWREVIEMAYQQGKEDAIDEFVEDAKKVIRHEASNAYNYGIPEFNSFAIIENGKMNLSEKPFEISAEYIINLLEHLKEQKNDQAEPNP